MNNPATDVSNTTLDPAFVQNAVNAASINALRIALYHQTRDPELAAMRVEERAVRGGALVAYSVAKEHHDEIRAKAVEYLLNKPEARPDPTKDEAIELMTLFSGQAPTASQADYGYEDLGFDELPRKAEWHKPVDQSKLNDFKITIIGSGISGIAAAVQLENLGLDYQILERHADIGGTWFVNDYPEARVDVSTFLYQYKFEKNYPWKSFYATQAELHDYLNHIVDKYGIRSKIRTNAELKTATWNEQSKQWDLTLSADGQTENTACNALISATGLFGTPNLPDIEGIESFEGALFHSTAWDHDFDYRGKRVALIGTGSTGSQLSRDLAEKAGHLTIYQRTANWVTPVEGYRDEVSTEKRWLLDNMPGYHNWYVYASYIAELQGQDLQVIDPDWVANGGRVNARNTALEKALTAYIRYKVGDRDDLFEKLLPPYPPMARRLVVDNGWYDTVIRDNVELISGGITKITPTGIVDQDGNEQAFDLIVLGAGFKVSKYLWPVRYTGRDGKTLEELWSADGARAYMGMTMPNFPNFFMFYGPNAQARAGSFHSWVEVLSRYIGSLLVELIESDSQAIEVRESAFEDYNQRMNQEMKSILWEQEGIGGYYVNKHGRSDVNMPWNMHQFYGLVREPKMDDYRLA